MKGTIAKSEIASATFSSQAARVYLVRVEIDQRVRPADIDYETICRS
jgi:hypothetical protein